MAIKKYYDSDCNLGVLDGKTVAIWQLTGRKKGWTKCFRL